MEDIQGSGSITVNEKEGSDEFEVYWSIPNFSRSSFPSERCISSMPFSLEFNGSKWRMGIFYTYQNPGYYGVRADCYSSVFSLSAMCTFSLLNRDKQLMYTDENDYHWTNFKEGNFAIKSKFVEENKIQELNHSLVPEGTLNIVFQGRILNQMAETDFIKLKIIRDFTPMEMLIESTYLEKDIDHIKNLFDVLIVANKYGMDSMKKICLEAMSKLLKPPNSIEIFRFARNINDENLINKAAIFIRENLSEVEKTIGWKDFKESFPDFSKFSIKLEEGVKIKMET